MIEDAGRPATEGREPARRDALGALIDLPVSVVSSIVVEVEEGVQTAVKPAAVAAVAQTFTFPLALMLVVLLFLLIQDRLDGRDPKLRQAPLTSAETALAFDDEDPT